MKVLIYGRVKWAVVAKHQQISRQDFLLLETIAYHFVEVWRHIDSTSEPWNPSTSSTFRWTLLGLVLDSGIKKVDTGATATPLRSF